MENILTFQAAEIDFVLPNESSVDQWIKEVIVLEQGKLSFINYIFCNDSYLLKLNEEYLNHDTFTDIITFDYSEHSIESDIFISIDRVRENATIHKTTFENELHRVIVHGVLHLLGHGDKTDADKIKMRALEEKMLLLLNE